MAESLFVSPLETMDESVVAQRFNEIISNIETVGDQLTKEEREALINTPVCKEVGQADQGYRYG